MQYQLLKNNDLTYIADNIEEIFTSVECRISVGLSSGL